MANPYETFLGSLVKGQVAAGEAKQQLLAEKTEAKRKYLDPDFEEFNPDLYEVEDGDTLVHRRTGEKIRIGKPRSGFHEDTFETYNHDDLTAATSARVYDLQPERFERHRKTYAKLYGKDPDDVSKEDLLLLGRVQTARLKNALPQMRGMGLRRHETDVYGRTVASFDDMSFFEQARDQNTGAGYFSPYNYNQRAKDLIEGRTSDIMAPEDRGVVRAVTGDLASNVATGTLQAANSLIHGAITLLPGTTPKPLDDFFVNNQERIEKLQNYLTSDEQTFRRKMDQKETALNEEFFNLRQSDYERRGLSKQQAKIAAGYDEFTDRLEYLYENPGQLLDATAESLPYMLGVGAVGRIAVNGAVKALTKQALASATKKGLTGEAAKAYAGARMAQFQTSRHGQALLNKVAEKSSVRTVGVTEGFTNASDAYISVIGMTEEEAQKSEKYRGLRATGLSHEEALTTLGEGVFVQTLLTTAAVAGLASKATGAAAFEGNIFRRGVVVEKAVKEGAKKQLKGGALLRGAQRAAFAGGRYARFAGKPGLKEAAEEAVQSGGGEFLSQLAEFNAGLTDNIGPGVGAATGEGLAVGFASGAGIQTVTGGAKKLAKVKVRSSGFEQIDPKKPVSRETLLDPRGNPGGSKAAAVERSKQLTPEQAQTRIDNIAKRLEEQDAGSATIIREFHNMRQAVEKFDLEDLSPERRAAWGKMQELYKTTINAEAEKIRKTKTPIEKLDATDKQILQVAMEEDAPAVRKMAKSDSTVARVYNQVKQTITAINRASKNALETAGIYSDIDKKYATQKIASEKMGRGLASNDKPGLLGHYDLISEAIAQGKDDLIRSRSEDLVNFIGSQRRKLKDVRQAIEDKADYKGVTYQAGKTEGYYNKLVDEMNDMVAVRDGLRDLYLAWKNEQPAETAQEQPAKKGKKSKIKIEKLEPRTPVKELPPIVIEKINVPSRSETSDQESEQAERTDKQPRTKSKPKSKKGSKQKADTSSKPESESAAAPESTAEAESQVEEGTDTEQAAPDAELKKLTVPALKKLARSRGITKGLRNIRKADLIKKILAKEKKQSAKAPTEPEGQGRPAEESAAPEEVQESETYVNDLYTLVEAGTIAQDKTYVQQALREIATNSGNPAYRLIADRVRKLLGNRELTLRWGDIKSVAQYDPVLNAISINKDRIDRKTSYLEQSILHEAIHAALNGWLRANNTHKLADEIRRIQQMVIRTINDNPSFSEDPIFQNIRQQLLIDRTGGEELITWGLTNPDMQRVMEATEAGNTNALQQFFSWVAKVLGLEKDSALTDLLKVSEELFYEMAPELRAEDVAVEQAEAQPERSSEAKSEGPTTEDIARNDILYETLDEARRLKHAVDSGALDPGAVRFTNSDMTRFYEGKRASEDVAGAIAALESVEQAIRDQLLPDVPRTKVSTEGLNIVEATAKARELAEKQSTTPASQVVQNPTSFNDESNWHRLKKWFGNTFSVAKTTKAIERAFAKLGVPYSLSQGFKQSRSSVQSLIAAVPNLHEILENPTARNQLYRSLKLTPSEELAFEAFRAFRKEFEQAVNQAFEDLTDNPIDYPDGNRIHQNPAYLLTDVSERMDPAAVTAMALESMNWLTGDGQSMINDDDTIRRVLGLPEGTALNKDQRRLMSSGTLRRHVVESIGQAAYRHLNLTANQSADIAPNLDDRMQYAIGSLAVRALTRMRRVEPISYANLEYQSMQGTEQTAFEVGHGVVNFIRAHPLSFKGSGRYQRSEANQRLLDSTRPGRTAFDKFFGVSSVNKEPLLEPPTERHIPKKALRSLTMLSKKLRKAIARNQALPWTTDTQMADTLKRFNMEEYLAAAHEYVPDLSTVHIDQIDGVLGRNRTLVQAFEDALQWSNTHPNQDFYLTYFVSKTGRTHVASTTINPQSSKIHRFLFRQKAWTVEVPLSDKKLLDNFKIAVALGMDFRIKGKGVDKLTQDDVLAQFDAYMDSKPVQDALAILAKDGSISLLGDENEPLRDLLSKNGTHTLASLLAWQEYQAARNNNAKSFTTSLPMEIDGVTNGFAAGLLQTPDPTGLEVTKDLSRATGMMYDDDNSLSFAEYLRDPNNRDNYQEAARRVAQYVRSKVFQKDIQKRNWAENIVAAGFGPSEEQLRDPVKGRKFAKSPLMVVAYGAGFKSVRAHMINLLVEEMYASLAETNKITDEAQQMEAVLDILNRAVLVMNTSQQAYYASRGWKLYKNQLKEPYTADDVAKMIASKGIKDYDGNVVTDIRGFAQNFRFSRSYDKDHKAKKKNYDLSNFTRGLDSVYGESLEQALEDMLGGMRETRKVYNHAVMAMNAIFRVEYDRRIRLAERQSGRKVGRRQQQEILAQMHREGLVPSIRTAYSTSLDENLELTAYSYLPLDGEQVKIVYPKVSSLTRRHYDKTGSFSKRDTGSMTNQLTIRTPSMNVGVAGIVGTIHSLDGTNSADVFGQFDVLNIFDAWVMSLKDMDDVSTHGSKRFAQQHREYDLGQELSTSLRRMMLLLEPGEGRFSTKEKEMVGKLLHEAMKDAKQLTKEFEEIGPAEITDYLANRQYTTADIVTEAREKLFKSMVRSDQFAHDGTGGYELSAEERGAPLPKPEQPLDYVKEKAAAEKTETKARTLANNLQDEGGNIIKATANWLQEEAVRPREALRVVARALEIMELPGSEAVVELLAMLHPHLDNIHPIIVGPTSTPGAYGETENGQIIINTDAMADDHNPLETVLHEIVHAATHNALEDAERNNPELLKEINERADYLEERLKEMDKRTSNQQDVLEALVYQKDPVLRAGEFLAWVQTTLSDVEGAFGRLFENTVTLTNAFESMGQLFTRQNTENPVIRSSTDKVNNKLFDEVELQKLESEKLWENYKAMEELDANTEVSSAEEYRDFIAPVMEDVLIPGLASLKNETFLQVGVEPDGTKNIGEVERASDRNILRVQAAGLKLHHNGGMSNQEVFAHELFHAVSGYAIEMDTKVRAELRRIYEGVRDQISWQDFMPPADEIAGDRAAVERAAQRMYDYIFGTQSKEVDQLQEFHAFALSNKAFATKLTQLETPRAVEPIWDGNLLSSLVNLISRGLEILRGETLRTRRAGNAHASLKKLAEKIVVINQQATARKLDKQGHEALWRNSADAKAAQVIKNVADAAQERLRTKTEQQRARGDIKNWIRMGTHAALAFRSEEHQKAFREFQRQMGVNRSGNLSQILTEIMPYNKDDRGGADGKIGFLDLLRHSKVLVDIGRQRQFEHTRRTLIDAFDKKRRMSKAERVALTNVLLRTDLVSLMEHNDTRTLTDLQRMLENPALVDAEIKRIETALQTELSKQNASRVSTMYQRQIMSLAKYMTTGIMGERNGMKNANNIVKQFNLSEASDRIAIKDPDALVPLVDQLATLHAIKMTPPSDVDIALNVISHEMARTDDNGFMFTLGMASDFKRSSLQDLFDGNPVQMRKGYVNDVTDGDINLEVIVDSPAERQRMEDLGMIRIGEVERDKYDRSTSSKRVLYKGYRGVNTWQKSIVSLTSQQAQGTNLFEVSGYDPRRTAFALGQMKDKQNTEALKQFRPGFVNPQETITIPVLDDRGNIVDYTYEMNLGTKKEHLKNRRHDDYFDLVIPHQFASITDKVESKKINAQVADLLYEEWDAFKDSPEHRFVFIGKNAPDKRAREMYMIMPDNMKRELASRFRGTEFEKGFPIRDEAVNLVLGFRKLSILDIPSGKGDDRKLIRGQRATFAAKTAEKIWQEIMQLVRIKMAITNPLVVIGNLSSNFGILLAEGIPVRYIQAKTSEAIRAMRQYQRDVREVDRLKREIGVRRANRQPTNKLVAERERLRAELRRNPVGQLVEEGLFTSIVEDISTDEGTYREWLISSGLEKVKGTLAPKAISIAKEVYMVPGSTAFNMAIAATQYGDFIGRYVKFKYDSEVKKVPKNQAINNALASFIYYDMPQNRWLQYANDNGFILFSKFFLRIQPVIAKMFQENPGKATAVLAAQSLLMDPFDENIGTFALFQGAGNRFHPLPFKHITKLDPTDPSLYQWLNMLGL